MKLFLMFFCCVALLAASPVYAEEVTTDVLTIEDVTPMLEDFAKSKNGQLAHVFGIWQDEYSKRAKIFFKYTVPGRKGPTAKRGEINCFKLNSGKWYCGGVYDYLKK
ncbi:MAG: hypothetical protein SWH54_20495 [Thermodesulfobacteriota bacterium]|nr:hypothetical protein [Thermodesulfobacteriota bacterium]